jgi:hypothetical protein
MSQAVRPVKDCQMAMMAPAAQFVGVPSLIKGRAFSLRSARKGSGIILVTPPVSPNLSFCQSKILAVGKDRDPRQTIARRD